MKWVVVTILVLVGSVYQADVYAQQKKPKYITGKVINDEDGQPLEGVTIVPKGSVSGTGTMPDGEFAIELPVGVTIIVITAPGFEKKEINVEKKTDVVVKLKPSNGTENL